MTFNIIALICSTALSHVECQRPTASDAIFVANVPNELRCMLDGQEHMAQAAGLIPKGYYLKIACERVSDETL